MACRDTPAVDEWDVDPSVDQFHRCRSIESSAYRALNPEKQQYECQRAVDLVHVVAPHGATQDLVRRVLRSHGWDVQTAAEHITQGVEDLVPKGARLMSSERPCTEVLELALSPDTGSQGHGASETCEICDESVPVTELLRTDPCGHVACARCWTRHVDMQIKDNNAKNVPCIGRRCKLLLDDDSVLHTASPIQRERARARLQEESFVEDSRSYNRWCPAPRCQNALQRQDTDSCDVLCDCGAGSCFDCGKDCHWPVPCKMMQKWEGLVPAMSRENVVPAVAKTTPTAINPGASYWEATVTKQCPGCARLIEKNGGCRFMHCKACGTRFCWECPFVCAPGHEHGAHSCTSKRSCAVPNDEVEKAVPPVLPPIPQLQLSAGREVPSARLLPFFRRFEEHRIAGIRAEQLLCSWGAAKRNPLEIEHSSFASLSKINAVRQLSECHYILKHVAVLEALGEVPELALANREYLAEVTQSLHDALVKWEPEGLGNLEGEIERYRQLSQNRIQVLQQVLRELGEEPPVYHAKRPSPYFEKIGPQPEFSHQTDRHPSYFLHPVAVQPTHAVPERADPQQGFDEYRFARETQEALRLSMVPQARQEDMDEDEAEQLAIAMSLSLYEEEMQY
eukprot:TRINITY_DN346_c0_g1_i1.p1 TRINITY_DN346_c0_g1~~TRINITY_DN346_c0_g1_i1.p1  ORF type:complete len:631 (-),score=76.29 TRINITY_DN346_c0_g1_i1:136-2004(-)